MQLDLTEDEIGFLLSILNSPLTIQAKPGDTGNARRTLDTMDSIVNKLKSAIIPQTEGESV